MSGYDEIKRDPDAPPEPYNPNAGPRVQRDCNMVKEIAEHSSDFVGHVKPCYYRGRDEEWRREE